MNPYLKNTLVIIGGLIIGNIVNFVCVMISVAIFPVPEGYDMADPEQFKALIPLLGAKHYVGAIAAHSLGTIAGVYFVARLVTKAPAFFGFTVGVIFLLLGLANAFSMPFPNWFRITDLVVSYLPMALIGNVLARRKRSDW